MRTHSVLILAALGSGLLCGQPATALTIAPIDQGSMDRVSSLIGVVIQHDASNTAMAVLSGNTGSIFSARRSYLLFDIPAGLDPSGGAVLRLTSILPATPSFGGQLAFHDIVSAAAEFAQDHDGIAALPVQALFSDLGSGALYGNAGPPSGTHPVVVQLTGQSLLDLQAARGGVFGIGISGGSFLSLPVGLSDATLDVSPVPEPATPALLLAGAAAMWLTGRLGRRAQSTWASA